MKRYIAITYFLSFLLISVIFISVCLGLLTKTQITSTRANLKTVVNSVKISEIPHGAEYNAFANELALADEKLRVTILDTYGNILGESDAEVSTMENHLDRLEIKEAINNGFGEDIRISETTNLRTMYVAVMMDDSIILRLAYPIYSAFAYLKSILPIIFIIFAVLLIMVHVFSKRFSDKLILPLYQINDMLEGKNSDVDKPIVASFSEVEPILSNIYYLVDKLHYNFEQIVKTQKMRSDFVANASHELKSPLTSIKGFADLMYSGMVLSDEKKKDYLERIVLESNRMLSIINDILHLSEAESKQKVNLTEVSLKKVTQEVLSALEYHADSKKISFITEGEGIITANYKEIWELIYNLVDNAIRYGKIGGYVRVKITDKGNSIVLSVKDNGIGIPQEHHSRVFERFYRIDKSHSRNSGGTGLGLSIVKNIAVKYNASLRLISKVDEGSEFLIKFIK